MKQDINLIKNTDKNRIDNKKAIDALDSVKLTFKQFNIDYENTLSLNEALGIILDYIVQSDISEQEKNKLIELLNNDIANKDKFISTLCSSKIDPQDKKALAMYQDLEDELKHKKKAVKILVDKLNNKFYIAVAVSILSAGGSIAVLYFQISPELAKALLYIGITSVAYAILIGKQKDD